MSEESPSRVPSHGTLTRFLLDQLPEEERQRIEARALEDGDWFEALEAAEDELLDAYAQGELAPEEAQRFGERVRASEELERRLAFARDLAREGARERARAGAEMGVEEGTERVRRRPWVLGSRRPRRRLEASAAKGPRQTAAKRTGRQRQAGLAAVFLAALGMAVWGSLELAELRRGLAAERAAVARQQEALEAANRRLQALAQRMEEESADNERLAGELAARSAEAARLRRQLAARDEAAAHPPATASFLLSLAGVVRGLEPPRRLAIPAGLDAVKLEVDLGADAGYGTYRVALRRIDGEEVWSRDGLTERVGHGGAALFLTLPARLLPADDYELAILGRTSGELEEVGYIPFRVRHEAD